MDTTQELQKHYTEIIKLLGEDPTREGLEKTPYRVAKAMQTLLRGYDMDPVGTLRSARFEENCQRMVLVRDIKFYSLCEHHMLPFYGTAHVAYIPNGTITGLSKLARVVDIFSHRLQVQERMTRQICQSVNEALSPKGVIVMLEARHMCMQMRGVEKDDSLTTTVDYCGCFENLEEREEFFRALKR